MKKTIKENKKELILLLVISVITIAFGIMIANIIHNSTNISKVITIRKYVVVE